jgi:hypothetical protein
LGGGGDAASSGTGLNDATANTGGGGGAGRSSATRSGNGGSGIIIFSVPLQGPTPIFSAGVTQTSATVGSKRVYTVTATSTTSETVTFP